MKKLIGLVLLAFVSCPVPSYATPPTPIVDTGQTVCYNNFTAIACPDSGEKFHGQDGNYSSNPPAYQDNGDGTVTDLVTGLIWSKGVDENKVSLQEAEEIAENMSLAGYNDWRVPNIKELYSLMNFSGNTGSPEKADQSGIPFDAIPFINTDYFDFRYGNTGAGERFIDGQWLSSTRYVSTTMGGSATLFGVNFADGRIKGYPDSKIRNGREKKYYARYVRGIHYGDNRLIDNNDGTIFDETTGLMWMQDDSGAPMSWEEALQYAEIMEYGGYHDWRLPNAKELQYLVDYTRSPDTTNSPTIDPVFHTTGITNEAGQQDYPFFWTSTTHVEGTRRNNGVYICFGRAIGSMRGKIMDVHGAGAQRSDPKTGSARLGMGPQGDAQRVNNFVRLVRGGEVTSLAGTLSKDKNQYPAKVTILANSKSSSGVKRSNLRPGQGRPGGQGQPQGLAGRGGGGEQFVTRLDKNGDNKVSKKEFDGPAHHFSDFDKNNDGYITAEEAPTGPPPGRKNQRFFP